MAHTIVTGRRGVLVLLALAGCAVLGIGVPAHASAVAPSANAAAGANAGADGRLSNVSRVVIVPPRLPGVRLPRPRVEVPERPLAVRPRRSAPVRPHAPDVVLTRFGPVSRETAARLEGDERYFHGLENEAGMELFPDSPVIRARFRICVSFGLFSAAKTLTKNELLSRDTTLADLATAFARDCLRRVFPGTRAGVAFTVASFGLNHSWPAVQQTARDSLEVQAFRNWLVTLSP